MAMLFAATYPERTAACALYGAPAAWVRAEDYPSARTGDELRDYIQRETPRLGTPAWCDDMLREFAPTDAHDDGTRRWWRRWVQASASPGAIHALRLMNSEIDVRHTLPAIRVPTLVVHRVDDEDTRIGEGRYIANNIGGAELVELPGIDHAWWFEPEQITRQVERFLVGIYDRGEWDVVEPNRVLATILFTDIADSTTKLAELGDRSWKQLLQQHHAVVRRQLARFSGRNSTRRATASSQVSMGPPGRSVARARSQRQSGTWDCRCEPAFIRANVNCSTTKSGGLPYTSARASRRRPPPARSWCPAPSRTLSRARASSFANVASSS